jgi:four helix bundle protein
VPTLRKQLGAQSRNDFKAKLSTSYKEARKTKYWLRLLRDSKLIKSDLTASLLQDCEELLKIIGTILKTLKNPHS